MYAVYSKLEFLEKPAFNLLKTRILIISFGIDEIVFTFNFFYSFTSIQKENATHLIINNI